jgi:hypothetical protein
LHRRRDLDSIERLVQPVAAGLAREHARLREGADAFFEKVRIAPGLLHERGRDGPEGGIRSEQDRQQLFGADGIERLEPDLRERRLAAPPQLVLGTAIDQQTDARGSHPLDEGVEKRLGFSVRPVQVLEHDQQRLVLAFPEEHASSGLIDLQPALGGIERRPMRILDRDIEEREDRRHELGEARIEGEEPIGHLVADRRGIVAIVDVKVRLEEPTKR